MHRTRRARQVASQHHRDQHKRSDRGPETHTIRKSQPLFAAALAEFARGGWTLFSWSAPETPDATQQWSYFFRRG
jgi:hypothetical protein